MNSLSLDNVNAQICYAEQIDTSQIRSHKARTNMPTLMLDWQRLENGSSLLWANRGTGGSSLNFNGKGGAADPVKLLNLPGCSFDATSQQCGKIIDNPDLNPGILDFYVSLWMNHTVATAATVLIKRDSPTTQIYQLYITSNSKVYFYVLQGGNLIFAKTFLSLSSTICHVFVGADRDGTMTIYLNGIQNGTSPNMSPVAGDLSPVADLMFGGYGIGNGWPYSDFLNGDMCIPTIHIGNFSQAEMAVRAKDIYERQRHIFT